MGSIFMENDHYKAWLKYNQYNIPKRLLYIASNYGDKLTYNQVTKLYAIAVEEVLTIHNITLIDDLPFGQGYSLVCDKWVEKLKEALNYMEYDNESRIKRDKKFN